MLYLMTRFGGAKTVTNVFEEVTGKKARTYREFVQKNLAAWQQ